MGDSKLCLLLLLSTSALAFAQDEDQPTCLLAKRYKTFHKYEYQYQAESHNEINGASPLKNGPKATCTVEVEVPQTCSFTLRTTGCSLNEVVDTDAEGNPVFEPAPSSDAFAAEMEKHPLRFVVEGEYDVKLYPEEGETTTILNFKRGIISALAVPLLEEDKNRNMPTIHGKCRTHYQVNAREDIATDVSLNRKLFKCDKFAPILDHSSPLALISGMHYPLAKLFNSFQTCNYKFDNDKKHMTSGSCTEKHILIPFSHKGEHGVTNVGRQELTLVQFSPHNDRVFERGDIVVGLHMDAVEDKSAIQDKDAFLKLLTRLANLPETEGEKRAHLFHKLVTMVRGMKAETLGPAIPEALAVSHALTYQVLAQCGTPECSSAIMQILRTFDKSSFNIDAAVYALGFISNPSALLISDMLEMAKHKPSKPIMYALSNVVKRFYKAERKVIPEISSVAQFMADSLGDCSGSEVDSFLILRVVGNMATAVIPASPELRSSVIRCVNQPAASLAVQQAAIQVYRLISVPEDDREPLMQVLLDGASPVQKRIAAYLVLMKDPRPSELVRLFEVLSSEQDIQVKSFVISHINNILASTEAETQELRQRIRDALQGNEIGPVMDRTRFSSNYKIGSVQGNMLFGGHGFLPKEVMLEMTLKAFGYDIEMMEFGMAGEGFEPLVEALFGENGFFPDTALKTMYFVSENMPSSVNEILENVLPTLKNNRMKRQAPTNLIKEIKHNFRTLAEQLLASESPEAMVYLRLLGNDLGYLRTSEAESMAFSTAKMIESVFKMLPTELMAALTKTDNTIFGHYIFMDNEFFLPTVTGVPLKIALSGTFTPGIKGGLRIARDMSEVTFMPSAGVEFVTHIGSHIPEYVNSGLEMHTNIFHESGLTAKISVNRDQVKLTIPAPTSPTKLIKITNTLVAVIRSELKTIPTIVGNKIDVGECTRVFAGMNYCSDQQYMDASSHETSPYFPLTGDSKFSMELQPTGEVTEYTATVAYELLREGEEGRQKVDSVKFSLRAEGAEPTEATATLKYNRKKIVLTADLQIPDYDVEAGIRLGVDGKTKGKGAHSISLDFVNKNIPQLSLVGRANLKAMKEGMLQGQLIVPLINADATVTANVKYDEELELELKSEIKLMDATSEQKIEMTYGGEKIEVEFKSDVSTKTANLPGAEVFAVYGEEFLNTQVGQTDMKVRHIFKKFLEAANNYVEKYRATIPYIKNFRIPDIPEMSLPEILFLNTEAKAAYYFSNEYFTFAVPVPFGGKSTKDFNFPSSLNTPSLSVPQFGLDVASVEIPIPELLVPVNLKVSIPLFGKADVSTQVSSNLYNMEASVVLNRDTPGYSATLNVKGTSPLDILSIQIDGLGNLAITDSIQANLKSSLTHKFIEARVSIEEETTFTEKITFRSGIQLEAMSPLGAEFKIEHTVMTGINVEEFSADNHFKGVFQVGRMLAKTISTQSFAFFPFKPEAKFDSDIEFDCPIAQAQNTISASFANGELSLMSNTKAFEDMLTHVAEVSYKDRKLSLKCDASALVLGMKIQRHTQASAGAGELTMNMETNVELSVENRGYSLLTATLDADGLAVNSDGTLKLLENRAIHKASLTINKEGLTTSGTTSLQSPLSLENTFNAGVDFSKASLTITNKAALSDISVNNANTMAITFSSLDITSKTQATASDYASYIQDVTIGLKPYSASANVINNLNLLSANFKNEAQLQTELYKIDVTGSLKATYGQEEIKHTYEVKYADLTAIAKFSTVGKVFGTHMNHNTELEVFGLAASITNEARFNSRPMRFDHSFRCSIVPFDISVDALFNADGEITMYGKHSAQLYGKYLLKAQPLAFASMQECRASVTNTLDNNFSFETTFDNNMGIVLSPQEQKTTFKMTSKMNEHSLNQGMSLYNTAERTGIEVASTIFTNILNPDSPENQEFTVSSFLKYDKNTDSFQFPLSENSAVILESIKGYVVQIAEALQNYINVYGLMLLDELNQDITTFISHLDVASKADLLKQSFSDFMKESLSSDYLESYVGELKIRLGYTQLSLFWLVKDLKAMIDEIMPSNVQVWQQLIALDDKYQIRKYILTKVEIFKPCIDEISSLIPEELLNDPIKYIVAKVFDISNKIRGLIEKHEVDKIIQPLLEKSAELFQKLKIQKTIMDAVHIVKEADIPAKLMDFFQSFIKYLKDTDVKSIIQQLKELNMFLAQVRLPHYNEFVDFINFITPESTAYLNELLRILEVPQKLEATKDFVNFLLSAFTGFMEKLREVKVVEIIKTFQYIIDEEMVGNIKGFAQILKQKITNLNLKDEISNYLVVVKTCYIRVINTITATLMDVVEMIKDAAPDQEIISEIQQFIIGLSKELMKTEVTLPSFPVPFTDLVVPSIVFRMDELKIPAQLDIPEFTILGSYTYKSTTISFDEIKQRIIELIDFIINLDVQELDVHAFFGDLRIIYLPSIPEISIPEITFPEISFPTIPTFPVEKFVKSLQVPDVMVPTIPIGITVPCFGKLYGEIKILTPLYAFKMSGEFQNATENKMTPQFTGLLNSQARSPYFEFLNYKLDSTARIAIPKMSRVVLAETVKFNHLALEIDHQASVAFYGRSGQAQAKTKATIKTTPYTANIVNDAFIAMGGGISASVNTMYNHLVDLPSIEVRSEASLTQKSVARQNGLTFSLTVDNSGEGKINDDDGNHKSNLQFSATPSTFTLTFSGDTDSTILKMKQQVTAESSPFTHFKFDLRNEAESPVIKNSVLVASGHGNIYDMKVELKVNHDMELYGEMSGVISNAINLVARPFEFIYDSQNKGNVMVSIFKTLSAKIDLQKDYSVILRPDKQQIATVALARLNQYKMFYNFTFNNAENEAGVFVAMEGAANLDFLTSPINIPEIYLPFTDFHTVAISELNLYEETGLKNILTTTDQTFDVDAKVVYQKGQPFAEIGLVQIPYLGNMITELSFKSAIINLNANAGLYAEDNLVFRLGATTASVFESLNAKLYGTTSLTTKRGIKLASSLSFENVHVTSSHDSTISTSSETFETTVSSATAAKIALPIFNLETKQNFGANTKNKVNVLSTFTMKADFDLPVINAVAKAEADHNMKLEGTFEYISMESTTRANMDGTIDTNYLLLGVLDNEVTVYLNKDGLRSTSKVTADAKVNHGTDRVIGMDVNESLDVEASLSHVYAVLRHTGNNEAKLYNFKTKEKHTAQATIDFAPTFSLSANTESDIFQQSNLGVLSFSGKTVAEVTVPKQKIATTAKFSSPLYTTNLEAELEGQLPVFRATFKSAGTSDVVNFEHDVTASTTASFENEALNIITKAALTGADITIDVNHIITNALRFKHQADNSVSRHNFNVDIARSTVTYANLQYTAERNGISASVSTLYTGLLGLQVIGPFPMSARVYNRNPSAPEVDVDILVIKSSPTDNDEINLQIAYNIEAHKVMLSELKSNLHAIMSTFIEVADKSLTELTKYIAVALDKTINAILAKIEVYYTSFVNNISSIELQMPDGDVMTGDQIWEKAEARFKTIYQELMDSVNSMESLGSILSKIYDIVNDAVENFEEFVDSVTSEYLDAVSTDINAFYDNLDVNFKNSVDQITSEYSEQFTKVYDYITEVLNNLFDQYIVFSGNLFDFQTQVLEEAKPYIDVSEGRLEINFAIPFHQ